MNETTIYVPIVLGNLRSEKNPLPWIAKSLDFPQIDFVNSISGPSKHSLLFINIFLDDIFCFLYLIFSKMIGSFSTQIHFVLEGA